MVPNGLRPPAWVDAAWWAVYSWPLVCESLARDEWIEQLATAWQLVRTPEALTVAQRGRQERMVNNLLGRVFLLTYPPPWERHD